MHVPAVATVQFCVTTPSGEDFEMAVSPMTRIATVRKMLEEVDTDTKYEEYWFSLDGVDNLKETRTFWDLDIKTGSMILLSKRTSHLVILRPKFNQAYIIRETMYYHFDYSL